MLMALLAMENGKKPDLRGGYLLLLPFFFFPKGNEHMESMFSSRAHK